MIHIVITARGEPKSTVKSVKAFLDNKISGDYKILVVDPYPDVRDVIEKEFKGNKNIEFFLDPDEGKSFALNLILQNNWSKDKNDVFIFSDGDVHVSNNAVKDIMSKFKDEKVGMVCGHPISINKKDNIFGYWAGFQFYAMNKIRKKLEKRDNFFETSGYLFAMRNGVITGFPLDASEDSIIPFLFQEKGYKIAYAEDAEVYVLNPQNWKDWLNQRKRNVKGHSNIDHLKGKSSKKRTKSMKNEIINGMGLSFRYVHNFRELVWMKTFYLARLYSWGLAYYEMKFKKQIYKDGWRETEIESTKPLD